jgi:predicted  nucleic acid-binding Zn-ribbon protein
MQINVHVYLAGLDEIHGLAIALAHIRERLKIMATKQDVLDAAAAEAAEVAARLNELATKIADLEAQVAAGTASSADWDEVKAAVQNIFTPA